MIEFLQKLSAILFNIMRGLFDLSANAVDHIVKKIGPKGYFFYGGFAIKMFPQVDWSIVMIIRGVFTFAASQLIAYTYDKPLYYEGKELFFVTIRNFLMAIYSFIFIYALLVVPINIIWVINNTGPLFIFVIAYFILGTAITQRDILFILISVLGVNMITLPQIFLNLLSIIIPMDEKDLQNEMNGYQILISLVWIGGVALWGLSIVIIRLCKTTSLSISNNIGIQFIFFGSVTYFYRYDTIYLPSLYEVLCILLFHCIPVFLSQIIFIHGTIVAEDQGKYSLTNYIPVFYSYAIQIIFQGRNPKFIEFVGVFLSFYGLYKILVKPKPSVNQEEVKQTLLQQKVDHENQCQENDDDCEQNQNNQKHNDQTLIKQDNNSDMYELKDLRQENCYNPKLKQQRQI